MEQKSDEIATAEMREREVRGYLEMQGLHLVQRPMPPMPQITLGRSPASPYGVLRAEWYGVVWAMETRWSYQEHPASRTLNRFLKAVDLPRSHAAGLLPVI